MAVPPALAVSGAVARAPRPTGGGGDRRRGSGSGRPSPSLVFLSRNETPSLLNHSLAHPPIKSARVMW